MSDGNRLSIQPVWGTNRKLSYGVLDAAENLLQNIDELSDVLDQLTEKYDEAQEQTTKSSLQTDQEQDDDEEEADGGITIIVPNITITNPTYSETAEDDETAEQDDNTEQPETAEIDETAEQEESLNNSRVEKPGLRMFLKLKTCLDSTRHLIGSLRREKGRLMKREMSVECRMSEIEDYKTHMKQDLTSLNDLVDLLSARVIQLEDKLVDEQEKYEKQQAEIDEIKDSFERAENLCKDLSDDNDCLLNEIRSLKLERTDNNYKIDALVEENHKLKELLREQCESDSGISNDGKHNSDTDSELSYDLGLSSLPSVFDEQYISDYSEKAEATS